MMESLSLEVENIIKDIKNLFRWEKETKSISDKIIRDIKNLFEHEEKKDYYKPVRVSNFWSYNYIENENNSDRNKTLSVEEYLNEIRTFLKDIINNLKKFDKLQVQLTFINYYFISSIDNNEESVIHWESDNIEIMINDEADETIEELFKSLKNSYQIIRNWWWRFVFQYVHLCKSYQ